MKKSKLSKEEINELPMRYFEGSIQIIDKREDVSAVIKKLNKESAIGFDTECRPSFSKGESYPVSLLQLSSENEAFLFRLNKISFEGELVELLGNGNIKKVGVAIRDDIKALQKLHSFEAAGFIELADLAKENKIENLGLRSMAAFLLGFKISKRAKLSNWAQDKLTVAQERYAATDAWVGLKIYQKFKELEAKKSD